MKRLTLDRITHVLPQLDELRPVLDHLIAQSVPDPEEAWTAGGELGTVGGRLVSSEKLTSAVDELTDAVHDRISSLYSAVAEAIRCLGESDGAAAAEALLRVAALEEGLDHPDRAEAWAAAAFRAVHEERDRRPVSLALRRWARAESAQGKLVEALVRYEQAQIYGGYRPLVSLSPEVILPGGQVSCLSCHAGYSREHGRPPQTSNGLCAECHDL